MHYTFHGIEMLRVIVPEVNFVLSEDEHEEEKEEISS